MNIKIKAVALLFGFLLFSTVTLSVSSAQDDWWNDAWSFRQELMLDSLPNEENIAYQPVDIAIHFDSPCWAVNETQNSIRVICQHHNKPLELDSQIYSLTHEDPTHISSCNLVFLIPPEADGTEQYFVYFDDSQTPYSMYPDHVSIEESSYYYEPIPGYPLESRYYGITQDGFIKYIVAQEGTFLWYTTSQCVTKLKEGSTEVTPKNGETIASFEFVYYYGNEMWEYSSTSQELLTSEIICDGNLMVCCKILSRSTDGNLQTTAVYKYFYNPTAYDRIQAHVTHEALKECRVDAGQNTDGTYASLQCGGIRSASIADLNFGQIYPFVSFPSEQNILQQYAVDLHPESTLKDPVIWLLTPTDNVNLGVAPWVSFHEGQNGAVHAILFDSSSVVKVGNDERDGIQLNIYESNYPHLPGLDYALASIECGRNSVGNDRPGTDTIIPEGFVAEFNAEFFSSPTGGVSLVQQESKIFQTLAPMKPKSHDNESSSETPVLDRFSLMVSLHNALSFPFGSVFSALTGGHFPYLTVEVCQDERILRAGTAGRLPLHGSLSSEESTLKDSFVSVVRMLDFRNLSVFKRFYFNDLEAGQYVIKVYRENPWFSNQRRYIGCMVVDLTEDSSVHVRCQPQGSCLVSLTDQHGFAVTDAQVMLLKQGMIIAQNVTNRDGVAQLTVPCDRKESYQLIIRFQGFEITNESIRIGYSRLLVPLKKSVDIEQYDWIVTLVDEWGLPPEIDLIPRLTSKEFQSPLILFPEHSIDNSYQFVHLLPSTYRLQVQYQSFHFEKDIQIPSSDESIEIPVIYPVSFHVFDSHGLKLSQVTLQLSRDGINKELTGNDSVFSSLLPPGVYSTQTISNGVVIGRRPVQILSERSVDLVTTQEPLYPFFIILIGCLSSVLGVALTLLKKEVFYVLLCSSIGILIISLIYPWWNLSGGTAEIEFSSTLFLIPLNLITQATTPQVIAGELAILPEPFPSIMLVIPLITSIVILLTSLLLILTERRKKRFFVPLFITNILLCFCGIGLFLGAISVFTDVGVGSINGTGILDVILPGEDIAVSVDCSWGPAAGFWLYTLATVILLVSLGILLYQKIKKR
jgi:hypothetical protein